MDTINKRWDIRPPAPELSNKISQSLNISPLVSQILINRGLDTPDLANHFLSSGLSDLHSPFLMKHMDRAVDRIVAAIKNNEKIYIYGDYDVDGITATTIVVLFLRELGADVSFYIPNRLSEGYSLNVNALKKIKADKAALIITVDCGISDCEAVTYANSLGMDVVVTDHHEVPEAMVPACAIINPKQPGCKFPFKGLAGVGVAFNLLMAIRKVLRDSGFWQCSEQPNLKKYLDLVALGTVADVVPMMDENRIFVKNGLEIISEGKRPGIKALKSIGGIPDGDITPSLLSYRIAPRINAPGRLSDAKKCINLLLSVDYSEALSMAKEIDSENTLRQKIERKILSEARAMVESSESLSGSIVLASQAWHFGVVGICASRLSNEFCRPSILIASDEKSGKGRGSARSIRGFDVYNALKDCSSLLDSFGGHKAAAGLTLPMKNMDLFVEKFNAAAKNKLMEEDFIPVIDVDARISLSELSYDIFEEIETLSPFGPSNPEPILCTDDIKSYSSMVVGNYHLKLKIKENGKFFDAIGFNMAAGYCLNNEDLSLAFVPQFNFFNGKKNIQLNLKGIKLPLE